MGPASNTEVDVWLTFRNDKDSGMGMPLPAGRIRVSQQDKADGSLEFIGEDTIKHTPKDEDVRVKLGTAFDVVGERRQTDFTVNTKGRVMEEAFEIKVRNHKEQAVEVIVRENLYRWSQWSLIRAVAGVGQEGRAHDRVPGQGRRGRRGDDHLPRPLHLVTKGTFTLLPTGRIVGLLAASKVNVPLVNR